MVAAPRSARPVLSGPGRQARSVATLLALLAALGGLTFGRLAALAGETAGLAQASGGPAATRVYVPALAFRGSTDVCAATLSVTNLGPETAKAILLAWPAPASGSPSCEAPVQVLCSGLLRPGSAWDFAPSGIGGLGSAVVYSFSARHLSEIGVNQAEDALVADYVCDQLKATVIGDCAAYAAFAAAFAAGGSHFGLPLDQAAGAPLAIQVYRRCPGEDTPGVEVTSAYGGLGAPELGLTDPPPNTYRYHAAPIHADYRGQSSFLYLQNAGTVPASVQVWFQATDACSGGEMCRTVDIDPGASAVVAAADCVGEGWRGGAWLHSPAPLAVAVDTAGQDALASFTGVAPQPGADALGAPAFTDRNLAAYGPLIFDGERGWETEISVQNTSQTETARVTVSFLDGGGALLASRSAEICPRGNHVFLLPIADDRPGSSAGSVRVLSEAGAGAGAPIAAVASLRKYSDLARIQVVEAMAYNLLPESAAFAWPAGRGSGGSVSGSGLVVLPRLWKDLESSGLTVELALSNLVAEPGWTEAAILVYDQNDLVDVYCRRLGAGQTSYLNLQSIGAVAPGFRGSALVSATYWEHPVPADAAGPARQLLGLGAMALLRYQTRLDEDIPGDELAGTTGLPLPAWPDAGALPAEPCDPRPASAQNVAPGGHWQSVVPVYGDWAGRNSQFTVQNAGEGPTTVRLRYKALGDCLRERICSSEELAPGEEATLDASDCIGPDFAGSVLLHSREPLTVSAETLGHDPGQRWPVSPRPGGLPFDLNGDGRVDSGDRAALEAARGSSPGGPGWNPLADLNADGAVNDGDLEMLVVSLCGADRAPGTEELAPPARSASTVGLPVLTFNGDLAACQSEITVQNLGPEPAKALLVSFGAPAGDGSCAGPLALTCSGLLGPGGAWHFAAAALPGGAKSGQIFGLSMRPLSALGATVGGDEPAADYLCRTLPAQLTGDCAAYAAFSAAFGAGADYQGIPLAQAATGGLLSQVQRDCPGDRTPTGLTTTSYVGIGAQELTVEDPALGFFETLVPLIYGQKAGFDTVIYVQNLGAQPAEVRPVAMHQDDCSGEVRCSAATIAPGETLSWRPSGNPQTNPLACVSVDWQGSARLESDQPLAVLVEVRGRDVAFSYTARAAQVAHDVNSQPLPASERTRAFGSLLFGHESGWDSGIQVQNLSRVRPALVRVEFLDQRGAQVEVLDDLICAAGSQTFFLPVQEARPGRAVGSVRVVSQRLANEPAAPAAPIQALVMGLRYSDSARSRSLEAFAYELLPEPAALNRPAAGGEPPAGAGALALTGLSGGGEAGSSGELAIHNLVQAPGTTTVAVLLFDANGLVNILCRSLAAQEVDYLDLATLGLAPGFRGSALVSATAWQHPVGGIGRGPEANLVGLGAVLVTRRAGGANDPLGTSLAQPLGRVPAALGHDALERCGLAPSATPPTSATPSTQPTSATPSPTSPTAVTTGTATPTGDPLATGTPTGTGIPGPTGTAAATATTAPDTGSKVFLPFGMKR